MKLKFVHKIAIVIGVPLIFQVAAFSMLYVALKGAEQEIKKESFAKELSNHINAVSKLSMNARASMYRQDKKWTRDDAQYRKALIDLKEEFKILHVMLADRPEQLKLVARLEHQITQVLKLAELGADAFDKQNYANWLLCLQDSAKVAQPLSATFNQLDLENQRILDTSPERQAAYRELLEQSLLVGIVASVFLSAGLAAFFNKDITRRLTILLDNTQLFARGQALNKPISGGDEIAELDRVFHSMVDTLKAAEQQKQEFLAMITHDLRTPLTSVRISLDLIGKAPEKAQRMVANCDESLERVISLINDLLDAAKMSSGKMELHFEMVPIAHLFSEAQKAVEGMAERGGQNLEIPEAPDIEIWVDEKAILRVLENLLANAIKYSPPHGRVSLTAQILEQWLEFNVTDEGKGIAVADQERIFDKFEQVKGERKKNSSGLGLSICKEIVELHGGQIGVRSQPVKGSNFWFRLPLKDDVVK